MISFSLLHASVDHAGLLRSSFLIHCVAFVGLHRVEILSGLGELFRVDRE